MGLMTVETVKIAVDVSEQNPLGFVIINKDDFSDDMKLFGDESSNDKLTVAQIRDLLTEKNIDFAPNAKKSELIELLNSAE